MSQFREIMLTVEARLHPKSSRGELTDVVKQVAEFSATAPELSPGSPSG